MISEAIQKICELDRKASPMVVVDDRRYNVQGGALVPILTPRPNTMSFSTLTGLVGWTKEQNEYKDAFFIVDKHNVVRLYSGLFGEFLQRAEIAVAEHSIPAFPWGEYLEPEDFVVRCLTFFQPSDDRAKILKIAGTVKEENVKSIHDDGISQTVTARAGIVTVGDVVLPNPVTLFPYVTFSEIPQPNTPFVFRARSGPKFALFKTASDQWTVECKQNILQWLKTAAPEVKVYA